MRLVQVIKDYIAKSTLTVLGDMIVRGAAGPERLASGAVDTYLRGNGAGVLPSYESILPEAWIAPTLLNSWVIQAATNTQPGYYKDKFGIVHLRGLVKDGIIGGLTPIFLLPVGYRPAYKNHFAVVSDSAFGLCGIDADGDVHGQEGSSIWFSLDGITFRAV